MTEMMLMMGTAANAIDLVMVRERGLRDLLMTPIVTAAAERSPAIVTETEIVSAQNDHTEIADTGILIVIIGMESAEDIAKRVTETKIMTEIIGIMTGTGRWNAAWEKSALTVEAEITIALIERAAEQGTWKESTAMPERRETEKRSPQLNQRLILSEINELFSHFRDAGLLVILLLSLVQKNIDMILVQEDLACFALSFY